MKRRWIRWAAVLASTALGIVIIRAAITNGPQHAILPSSVGLSRIAPGVWTDAPARSDTLVATLSEARAQAENFFQSPIQPKRIILCTMAPCAEKMRLQTLGLTYGAHLVLIGPKGINKSVIGHELSHIALNSRMGVRDVLKPRFPAWFNEGLAVHLFPDSRYRVFPNPGRVRTAVTFRDWRRFVTAENWPQAYGSAGALVSEMAAEMGPGGLRDFIEEVARTRDFDAAIKRLDLH